MEGRQGIFLCKGCSCALHMGTASLGVGVARDSRLCGLDGEQAAELEVLDDGELLKTLQRWKDTSLRVSFYPTTSTIIVLGKPAFSGKDCHAVEKVLVMASIQSYEFFCINVKGEHS